MSSLICEWGSKGNVDKGYMDEKKSLSRGRQKKTLGRGGTVGVRT
jgi:hypothetical protein